jgi:hypothetical protein
MESDSGGVVQSQESDRRQPPEPGARGLEELRHSLVGPKRVEPTGISLRFVSEVKHPAPRDGVRAQRRDDLGTIAIEDGELALDGRAPVELSHSSNGSAAGQRLARGTGAGGHDRSSKLASGDEPLELAGVGLRADTDQSRAGCGPHVPEPPEPGQASRPFAGT